jgi:hypothetical protein
MGVEHADDIRGEIIGLFYAETQVERWHLRSKRLSLLDGYAGEAYGIFCGRS